MQQIRMVDIEDVYPLEDEYGNKITQRDLDNKANQKYIKELASTFRDGIPDTPPILVEDGGIYRIKDGNCRINAMRTLGTKRFPAIIDDEGTEQAIVETVLRTNCKKKYEPIEESRFVQQLALLDADDYAVAKVAGIEPEKVKQIRKGVQLAGDAREDMTLERLIAIEEFSDDDEVVEELINMSEKEFPRFYEIESRRREKAQTRQAIIEALNERGIEHGERHHPGGYQYHKFISTPKEVEKLPSDSYVEVWPEFFYAYIPAKDEVDPEAEAHKAFVETEKLQLEQDLKNRIQWFEEITNSDTSILVLAPYIREWMDDFLSKNWPTDNPPRYVISKNIALCAFASDRGNRKEGPYGMDFTSFPWADEYADTLDTYIECGYDPTDHELSLLNKCRGNSNE